ncbi:hypothetical protein EJ04DRAFT_525205 [Polyplosphaeria fusca]|uniref:RRM domain-containing protein n=1 Tax=Polyplosphaeria fusca TaxID=682080 RepID=A0A9P4QTY1_9PLEO|nr:hypothetical protein EJ04DRAFT_525205 [Polyplosphaeria fusca]
MASGRSNLLATVGYTTSAGGRRRNRTSTAGAFEVAKAAAGWTRAMSHTHRAPTTPTPTPSTTSKPSRSRSRSRNRSRNRNRRRGFGRRRASDAARAALVTPRRRRVPLAQQHSKLREGGRAQPLSARAVGDTAQRSLGRASQAKTSLDVARRRGRGAEGIAGVLCRLSAARRAVRKSSYRCEGRSSCARDCATLRPWGPSTHPTLQQRFLARVNKAPTRLPVCLFAFSPPPSSPRTPAHPHTLTRSPPGRPPPLPSSFLQPPPSPSAIRPLTPPPPPPPAADTHSFAAAPSGPRPHCLLGLRATIARCPQFTLLPPASLRHGQRAANCPPSGPRARPIAPLPAALPLASPSFPLAFPRQTRAARDARRAQQQLLAPACAILLAQVPAARHTSHRVAHQPASFSPPPSRIAVAAPIHARTDLCCVAALRLDRRRAPIVPLPPAPALPPPHPEPAQHNDVSKLFCTLDPPSVQALYCTTFPSLLPSSPPSPNTLLASHASTASTRSLCPPLGHGDNGKTKESMAGGPSPSSTSPSNLSNSPFLHGSFSSTSSSPPKQPFAPQNTMTADVFSASHAYNLPAPIGERRAMDMNGHSLLSFSEAETTPEPKGQSAIFLRKLPSNSDREAVRNILLFAKDLIDCEVVPASKYSEDKGFASAVARFKTVDGAKEARDLLNGKRNATNDAMLIVDLVQDGVPGAIGSRRNTVDGISARQGSVSTASGIAGPAPNGRQSSRYNGTFQNMEKMSPPNGTPGLGNGEFPVQNLFSPTSPVNSTFSHRNLGKSVINDEADDDEGLLKESIGFATGGPTMQNHIARRTTNPSIPVSRFSSLSLNTNGVNGVNGMSPPPVPNYASPRSAATMQSPATTLSAMSPHTMPSTLNNLGGPNANYQQYTQQYSRHNYPPVNPADQNPPCNTLYVGNLPMDTSEDELKAIFSKQRGYKRLCFRTKQNGPMCFVEFEDVSFATKALNELYGQPLHNSVKGGIRLSFSKNPLGVRTGQSTSMGSASSISPAASMPGFGGAVAAPPGFSTVTGPPPGLTAPPPGLPTPVHSNGNSGFNVYANGGFGMAANDMASPLRAQSLGTPLSTTVSGNSFGMGAGYSAYMMGR